jgi:hypothetical protein
MEMTSHRISHLAAALAGFLTTSFIATQVLAQEIRSDQVAERALNRRAIESVIWGMPAVNAQLMFDAAKESGGDFNQIVYWSRPLTWKNQTLTPNPNTIYIFPTYNTKDVGPMVLEIPPADGEDSITGSVDDGWQTALEDVGPAGVDKGKGGKYLILPPGHKEKEKVPDGYIALPSSTYTGFAILRSNLKSGSEADVAKAVAYGKRVKFYPLSQASNPPETKFIDAINVVFDSTIPYDVRFYEALDRFVQREPWIDRDRVMIDQLRTIGIEKGKPFKPDENTKRVLNDAVREAHAWLNDYYELLLATPYDKGARWALPASPAVLEGMMTDFANPNAYPVDGRGVTYSYAWFSPKHLGEGQFYLMDIADKDGKPLDGVSTYRLHVPANAPVRLYWSATVYDRATHAFIREMPKLAWTDEERRRLGGRLLRPDSARGEGIKLGANESRRQVRGDVPVLWPGEAFVRQDVEARRHREAELSKRAT